MKRSLFIWASLGLLLVTRGGYAEPLSDKLLMEMSLEELMNLDISTASSLTETSRRKTPSTTTVITKQQIHESGARHLTELLEIYVPGFQWQFQGPRPIEWGMRGIISDRNDKQLLLVNGRVMNERTSYGIISEIDLPTLSDIQEVEVVRGPGSALHGPGAIAMVISITTENARDFQGIETQVRHGFEERFQSVEAKFAKTYSGGHGLYAYVGASEYPGADQDRSPFYMGRDRWGVGAEENAKEWTANYLQAHRGQTKWKTHIQYNNGGFDLWYRHTKGGHHHMGAPRGQDQSGYGQSTWQGTYDKALSDTFSMKGTLSFDRTWSEKVDGDNETIDWASTEEECLAKLIGRWTPNERHSLAFGGAWSHEEFGLPHNGVAYFKRQLPRWDVDTRSILGEYRWDATTWFTAAFSWRFDWTNFMDRMDSPRGALIFTPTHRDTIKVMASRSVRWNEAATLQDEYDDASIARNSDESLDTESDPEIIKAYELRYERSLATHTLFGAGMYYHNIDIVGHNFTLNRRSVIGNIRSYGLEAEIQAKYKRWRWRLSHNYTKMTEFSVVEGITKSHISSSPFGYGHDINGWSNHETKAGLNCNLSENVVFDTALMVYWRYTGSYWYAHSRGGDNAVVDSEPFYANVIWNMGLSCKLNENASLRIHGHNLVGLFDENAGKRHVYGHQGFPRAYRVQPTDLSVSLVLRTK